MVRPIEERLLGHLDLHARGTTDAAYWRLLDEVIEAAREIERLRKWRSDASELLVQGARYEHGDTAEHLRLLQEAGYESVPEWLDGS